MSPSLCLLWIPCQHRQMVQPAHLSIFCIICQPRSVFWTYNLMWWHHPYSVTLILPLLCFFKKYIFILLFLFWLLRVLVWALGVFKSKPLRWRSNSPDKFTRTPAAMHTIVYSLPASRGTGSLRYSNSLEPLRELETVRIRLVKDFIDEP